MLKLQISPILIHRFKYNFIRKIEACKPEGGFMVREQIFYLFGIVVEECASANRTKPKYVW